MTVQPTSPLHQDRGYAWVVCLASFLTHLIYCGVYFSMGMFYIIFSDNLAGDNMALSFVSSLNSGVYYGTSPLVSILVARFGERRTSICGAVISCVGLLLASRATQVYQIYIAFGVITGFGLSLQCISALTVLPIYFDVWLGVASGIASSGAGVGSFIFPFLINYLTDEYGWRGALVIIAGIQLQCIVTSAFYRPHPLTTATSRDPALEDKSRLCIVEKPTDELMSSTDTSNQESPTRHSIQKDHECKSPSQEGRISTLARCRSGITGYFSIFQYRVFTVFCFSELLFMTAMVIVYTHLGNFARHLGFTTSDAVLLFLVIGGTNAILRCLSGVITQLPGFHPMRVCLVTLPLGVATGLFSLYTTLELLILYGVLFGMFIAPHIVLSVKVSKELLPAERVSAGIAVIYVFFAPGSLVGAPLAGLIYDATGVYVYSFYLASGLLLASGFLVIVCLWCNREGKYSFTERAWPSDDCQTKTVL